MKFEPVLTKVCVNEGTQIAVIEEFQTLGSPYAATYQNPTYVFLDGGVCFNVSLPEYKREPMESEYRELEHINDIYGAYELECADFVPTIFVNGRKLDGKRFTGSN